ncbi:P-loop containing nucleoside triphosphate hydrolase protein [Xylariaceae sp. AK1471]|nr:P-loop containing nucleoside triphosphate hydrolase protein [Xylariaceae sp. AK1471]
MSRESGSSSRRHIYGHPSGEDHDRHIQNIIDHTSSLFPDTQYQLPQLCTPSTTDWNQDSHIDALGHINKEANEYGALDDFDQRVLGRSQAAYHPSSTRSFSNTSSLSQRLSLPLSASVNRPSRVLGDASHHFRPFVPRDPDYQSPFQSNPHRHDEPEEIGRGYSRHGIQLRVDSPQISPHQSSVQSAVARFEPPQPSSSSHSIFNQNSTRRVGELQRGTQLFAPIFHKSKKTPPINSSVTSSSPSNAGHSSPSARISIQRQKQVANRNQQVPKWNQKLQFDLDHASNLPPVVNNTRLIDPRQSLPDKFRAVFPFQLFNAVQSKCFPLVYGTNDNVVISAPTGSGKTAVLELAICKLVSSQGGDNFKIVYQAPTKSLCSEKARDWQKRFSHMNLQCVELTGDTSQAEAHRVGSASIIVTTPEKWDSITRKWKDHRKLLDLVRLVLIDEVHILKDTRGATLEAVVSRMKTIGASIRFVAISATVPNIDDVAKWLGRDHQNRHDPARFEVFGEELRPVKLQRYVYGYEGVPNDFSFEKALDGKLNLLLAKHSQRKPIMIFCFTRKSCERTARTLAEWWSTCLVNDRAWPPPTNRIEASSQDLQEMVRYGIAFHHAGLDVQDRASVEKNFLNGQLHVICCTSTLAVGVNLPCHTVVLKGTSHYTDDGSQEYSDLEVMQMLGRAGRPQFDSSAVAIIMTRPANVQRYEKLVSGEELLESTLHRNLLEHLNSEISLGTIQDTQTAKKWISGTFLSVRVRQSPSLYNLENVQNAVGADEQMEEWCERDVKLLQDHGLVTKHTPLVCTEYGQAMSRYMVQFETMKSLLSIARAASVEEMLTVICKATEFKNFRFKPAERAIFRELNKSPLVLHPIRETLTLTWHKIFMIVQIHLGGVDLPTDKDTSLFRQDLLREKRVVFDRLSRLVRCIIDCKAFESDGLGTKAALELARSIAAHAWENKPAQLSQIPGFGPVAVRKWISHGVRTVLGVADKGVHDIERIASRNPPYGRNIQKLVENFPRLTLKVDIIESRAPSFQSEEPVLVTLKVRLGHCTTAAMPRWKDRVPALTFMALTSDGNLAYLWRGNMKKLDKSNGLDLKFPVALTAPNQTIFCHFSCEEIVGTQVTKALEPNIPASVFTNIRSRTTQSTVSKPGLMDDEEDYEDISDETMLEALEPSRQTNQQPAHEHPRPLDHAEEEFPLIDEVLSQDDANPGSEPARMANGRYVCNHQCGNGGLTKSGKPCTHRCCREGLEKYRPPKPIKKSSCLGGTCENDDLYNSRSEISQPPKPVKQPSGKKENSARSTSSTGPRHNDVHSNPKSKDYPVHQSSKPKRAQSFNGVGNLGVSTPKRAKLERLDSPSGFLSDIEYVDLCNVSDDGAPSPAIRKQPSTATPKQQQKSLHPREEVRDYGWASPLLTKSYKAKAGPTNGSSNDSVSSDEENFIPTGNTNAVCTSAKDDVFGGMDDEMSDLPELEELLCFKGSREQPKPSEVASPQMAWTSDETLYPGVVHTLKESMDYGLEPNLSFTTVDELQKASHRFNLPSTDDTARSRPLGSESSAKSPREPDFFASSSPLPDIPRLDVLVPAVPQTEEAIPNSHFSLDEDCLASTNSPAAKEQQKVDSEYRPTNEIAVPSEPAWLADFDPELIDSLRGVVNFID